MEQLSVTVRERSGSERRYLFEQTPISIGRSPDCDISILHEAVPRHLCRAWLEDGGRRVRVEERPGLTNSLELKGSAIRGGVSGTTLAIRVGPIEIELAPSHAARSTVDTRSKRSAALLAGLALAATAAACIASAAMGRDGMAPAALAALPESPFDVSDASPAAPSNNPDADRTRASLFSSRAAEVFSRAGSSPRERIDAANALHNACRLLFAARASADARACEALFEARRDEIVNEWRRDRLDLESALASGDTASVSRSARRLLGYLGAGRTAARRVLTGLIDPSEVASKEEQE